MSQKKKLKKEHRRQARELRIKNKKTNEKNKQN